MKLIPFALLLIIVVFLDSMAIGLSFPTIPSMLLKTGPYAFLPDNIPLANRGLLMGLIIVAFTAGQLFSSPLLGYISATQGYKKIFSLIFSLSVTAYLIGVAALMAKSVLLLFIFKFIVGISTSGRPVFQTALSQKLPLKKALLYGWLGASGGLGYIAGSFITQVGIETFPMIGRYTVFFFIAALLSLMNCLLIARALNHLPALSLQKPERFSKRLIELKRLMQKPALKPLFFLFLFYFIAWEIFYTFIPIFLIKHLLLLTEQTTVFYTAANFWNLIGYAVLEGVPQ